jgi:hypothetical protein
VVLWLGFKKLITGDRIPVLFRIPVSWTQVTIGMFTRGWSGARSDDLPGDCKSDGADWPRLRARDCRRRSRRRELMRQRRSG